MKQTVLAILAVVFAVSASTESDQNSGGSEALADTKTKVMWNGLEVRDEYTDAECPSYSDIRDEYAYSSKADLVIQHEFGGFYSPYDNVWWDEATDVSVEHMVARKEGHESGLCAASPELRYQFANDLLNLTLCTPSVNSSKSDKDAGDWLPDHNECWFVYRVIRVKKKYKLSIDTDERDEMQKVLRRCTMDDIFLKVPDNPNDTASSNNQSPSSDTAASDD